MQDVSLMTRQKLIQLAWEVLIHSPYSSHTAPSDFHLFRSVQNSNGKNFNSLGDCERHLQKFFAQKGWNYDVAPKMAKGSGTKQ